MAKVTSKYQVTLPRKIADHYAIRPGDQIDWIASGEVICVLPPGRSRDPIDREEQLRLFDQATRRHRLRPVNASPAHAEGRGWTREDLYTRGPRD